MINREHSYLETMELLSSEDAEFSCMFCILLQQRLERPAQRLKESLKKNVSAFTSIMFQVFLYSESQWGLKQHWTFIVH